MWLLLIPLPRTEPDGGRNWLMAYAPTGAKGIYIYIYIINPLRIIISYNIDPSPYTIHYHSTLLLTNSPLLSTGSRYVSWLSCSLKSVAFSLGLSILMSSWGFSYTGLLTRIKHLIKVLTNYEFIDKTY